MNAERLMLVGGIGAFVLTIYWVRSRDIREKYAVLWISLAFLLLLCGLFPRLIESFAEASRLSYPAAVLFIALAAIYAYSFTVTVSLTRQYRRSMRLTQEVALLEHRLRRLEEKAVDAKPRRDASPVVELTPFSPSTGRSLSSPYAFSEFKGS